MSTKLSLKAALERRGATQDVRRGPSDTRTLDVLLETATLPQPVEVARVLKRHGLSLRKAHEAINKLAETKTAIVAIPAEACDQLGADLLAFGVTSKRVTRPDVDPKRVRETSGLSQTDFARLYGLELDTLQNWEQGRNKPDSVAQIYLSIVQNFPEIPKAILTGKERDILVHRTTALNNMTMTITYKNEKISLPSSPFWSIYHIDAGSKPVRKSSGNKS